MSFNFYLNEKASEMHRQELLREAERQRLLAQLPSHRGKASKYVAGRPGPLLLWLGARLKQFEQKIPTILEDHP
ncbi:MAG TPA: hypothetical protein VF043_03065 [Ktedonobacteraceae bacterium]